MNILLVNKVEKTRVILNYKNIKKYKRTCREFNRKYNRVLNELLTDKYSLPTRKEWDILTFGINKLKKEIKSLKPNKKTEEEIFQESLEVFKEFRGEKTKDKAEIEVNKLLEEKQKQLELLLEHKNNIQILANNSNITKTTVNYIMGSSSFDTYLRSYFQRILVRSIDSFKAKPKNIEKTEFNKPLADLPKYRKINTLISLEFINTSYRFKRNNKGKIIGIKLGTLFQSLSFQDKFPDKLLSIDIKINNITLKPISEYSIIDGKFYLIINYEYNNLIPLPNFKDKVGLDMGLTDLVITSDGEKFNYSEGVLEKLESKRTRLQSLLLIKKNKNKNWKKSKRYKKLKYRVDKLYAKEKHIRENFAHEVSRYLVNKYDIITVEDLYIRSMIQNKNLSFKIARASWNRLANFLEYKCKNENKVFRKSYRRYPSTQICHKCKTKSNKFKGLQTLNIREWRCDKCGAYRDRDINAALNIRDWEPQSDKAIAGTNKMVDKVRRSQIRDFTNWIVFAFYLDKFRKDNTNQFLNKLLQVTNLKEITAEEDKYIKEIIEKDKNRKNKKYQLAINKLDELNRIKRIDKLENEINFNKFKNICLRLETLNIK